MATKSNIPYAVRNDIVTRVNVSSTGIWLDEVIKRCSNAFSHTLKTKKGYQGLLAALASYPTIVMHSLWNERGENRVWVTHTKKHAGHPLPADWSYNNPRAVEKVKMVEPEVVIVEPEPTSLTTLVSGTLVLPESCKPAKLSMLEVEQVGGEKSEPPPARSPVVHRTRNRRDPAVDGPFAGLKDLLESSKTQVAPVVADEEKPIEAIDKKETVKMADLTTATPSPLSLRQQAEQMFQLADRLEKQETYQAKLVEIREAQVDVARATATLHKLFDGMVDSMALLENASERLRKLVNS